MKQQIKKSGLEKKCQREEKLEGGTARMSSIAYTLQHLLGRFNEELFPEHGRCKHRKKKNQLHRFADDIALLAEDERMLRNMLMELYDRFEDYGMKTNKNKTKTMVVERKPKKIDMRIKDESVEKWTASNTWGAISVATWQKKLFTQKHFLRALGKRTTEEASEVLCVECSVLWWTDKIENSVVVVRVVE